MAPPIAGCQCSAARKAIGIPVVSEKARVVATDRGACQFLDQLPCCQVSPAAITSIPRDWEIWLGVVEAASDDPRIQRDHRSGAKHNYVFHSFGWLICCGELLNNAGFAKGAGDIGNVTPKIAARCDCALHRLIERAPQPRET